MKPFILVLFVAGALVTGFVTPAASSPPAAIDYSQRTTDGAVRDAYGVIAQVSASDPLAGAWSFLAHDGPAFGLPPVEDLTLTAVRTSLTATHIRFQQSWAGTPVVGGEVSLHVAHDGALVALHSRAVLDVVPLELGISAHAAVRIASSSAEGDVQAVRAVVYPTGTMGVHAWEIKFTQAFPLSAWTVVVDRATGAVLEAGDEVQAATAKGRVWINPIVHSNDTSLRDNLHSLDGMGPEGMLPAENHDFSKYYQTVELLDLASTPAGLRLEGPNVRIADAAAVAMEFVYEKEDPRFEEVMAYYWIDFAQRNIQALGFPNAANYQVPVYLHDQPGLFNAFYRGGTSGEGEIHFGWHGVEPAQGASRPVQGFADAAEDAEVIIHEYGHAVLNHQVPGFPSGMMHEGWADYFAATMGSRASYGSFDFCMAEWFTGYLGPPVNATTPLCLRNLENDMQWYAGIPSNHTTGQIWSGALWNMQKSLGRESMERLILEANFYLPLEGTPHAGAEALLTADAAMNNASHARLILTEFSSRNVTGLEVSPQVRLAIERALSVPADAASDAPEVVGAKDAEQEDTPVPAWIVFVGAAATLFVLARRRDQP